MSTQLDIYRTAVVLADQFVASDPSPSARELERTAYAYVPVANPADPADPAAGMSPQKAAAANGMTPGSRGGGAAEVTAETPLRLAYAFRDRSGFNQGMCRVVRVVVASSAVRWESKTDQDITPDMVPLAHVLASPAKKPMPLGSAGDMADAGGDSAQGSYIVLSQRCSGGGSFAGDGDGSSSVVDDASTEGAATADGNMRTVRLRNRWAKSWYDSAQQRFVVRTAEGAYRVHSLDADASAEVEVRPKAISKPDLHVTLSPGNRFLMVQRAPNSVIIFSVDDPTAEWTIKCRSKRKNNLVDSGCFFLQDNEVRVCVPYL